MRRWAGVIVALIVGITPASAGSRRQIIEDDPGGLLFQYVAKYVGWQNNGDTVRIEGDCYSACTLLLGLIPPTRICATRNAQFGFHSASEGSEYSEDATRVMWALYNDKVRAVLAKHGWKKPSFHPDLVMVDAQEIVKPCKWEDYHG